MFRRRFLMIAFYVLIVSIMFMKTPAAEAGLWRSWWSWFPFLNVIDSDLVSTSTPSSFTSTLTPPLKSSDVAPDKKSADMMSSKTTLPFHNNVESTIPSERDRLKNETLKGTPPRETPSKSLASSTKSTVNSDQTSKDNAAPSSDVTPSSTNKSPSVETPLSPEKKDFASMLIEQAQTYLGVPYRFGATYDQDGSYHFDCSAYTQRVYRDLGIQLPRTTAKQAKLGIPVKKEDLQVGDLVFFTTRKDRSMNHDGIYIGDGQFIHASPAGGKGVQISDLTTGYWQHAYLYARRLPDANISHK